MLTEIWTYLSLEIPRAKIKRSVMGFQNTCAIIFLQTQLPRTIIAGVTGDTVVVVVVTIATEQQAISFTPGKETQHFLGRSAMLMKIYPTDLVIASLFLT